jgi:ERCC4-type nuclease
MQFKYKYTEKEIDKLLKENLVIVTDTREQKNKHILEYFDSKGIQYQNKKLDAGDYGVKLLPDPELGIIREIHFPIMIEKKNSVDELAQSIKERARFEAEFIRAVKDNTKIHVLVEEDKGYENLINHKYQSEYNPKAFLGSLKAFENRYGFTTVFLDKKYSGNWIYYTLRYYIRESLKD